MSNPISIRIAKLVDKANKAYADMSAGKGFDAFIAAQNVINTEMNAIDKAAGDGLVVGRKLSFSVADGAAYYFVTKVRKNDCVVVHVPWGDAWQWEGVYRNANGELVIPRPIAERQCVASRAMAAIFGE
jgi:hypothetical protein